MWLIIAELTQCFLLWFRHQVLPVVVRLDHPKSKHVKVQSRLLAVVAVAEYTLDRAVEATIYLYDLS